MKIQSRKAIVLYSINQNEGSHHEEEVHKDVEVERGEHDARVLVAPHEDLDGDDDRRVEQERAAGHVHACSTTPTLSVTPSVRRGPCIPCLPGLSAEAVAAVTLIGKLRLQKAPGVTVKFPSFPIRRMGKDGRL